MSYSFHSGINLIRKTSDTDDLASLAVCGDFCPKLYSQQAIQLGSAEEIFSEIDPVLKKWDMRFIQFETTLTDVKTPIDKCGPNIQCTPETADLLTTRFDAALLANNHIGDNGPEVCLKTRKRLNEAGIKTVGAGGNESDAAEPLYFVKNKLHFAVLNFAEHEFGYATENSAGFASINPLDNIIRIQQTKQKADIVLVVLHGGHEYNPFPSPRMVQLCRAYADAGASAVVNIHTHCPEGIEIWNDKPIIYCPGNFFFPEKIQEDAFPPSWWTGYIPVFHCSKKGVYGLEIVPYYFDDKKIRIFPKEKEESFFDYLNTISDSLLHSDNLKRLFCIWSASNYGEILVNALRYSLQEYPGDILSQKYVKTMLAARDIITCESHNDVCKEYFHLLETYQLEKYKQCFSEIRQQQQPQYIMDIWNNMRKNVKSQ